MADITDSCVAESVYEDLYAYFFDRLRYEINQVRYGMTEAIQTNGAINRFLFELGDPGTVDALHEYVYPYARERAPIAIGELLAHMLMRKNDEVDRHAVGIFEESVYNESLSGALAPSFTIQRGREMETYVCTVDVPPETRLMQFAGNNRIKHIIDIVLVNPNETQGMTEWVETHDRAASSANEDMMKLEEDFGDFPFVNYITIERFFGRYFGLDEFENFMRHVRSFNTDVWNDVALGTVEVPTEDRLENWKSIFLENVLNKCDGFRSLLAESGMHVRAIDVLYENFVSNERCMSLIGNSLFADSFTSSEWLYSVHKVTAALEQTGTVAGYLKSVEQLLYAIAELTKGTGRMMPKKWDRVEKRYIDWVPFDESCDTTKLNSWQLMNYFDPSLNQGLLEIDEVYGRFASIFEGILHKYRMNDRNGFFHRDNLHDKARLDEIRENTFLIYFLVLGACKIESKDYHKLGFVVEMDMPTPLGVHDFQNLRQWIIESLESPTAQYLLRRKRLGVVVQADGLFMGHPYGGWRASGDPKRWQLDLHLFDYGEDGMGITANEVFGVRRREPVHTAPKPYRIEAKRSSRELESWLLWLADASTGLTSLLESRREIGFAYLASEELDIFTQLL